MQAGGKGALALLCCCSCVFLGGWITLIVYFGIFGLSNPNAEAIYGVLADKSESLYPD